MGQLHNITGPFRGIEHRTSHQTEQHLEIAINVNLSRGYIEPRPGRSYLRGPTVSTAAQTMSAGPHFLNMRIEQGQMHMINRPAGGSPTLLVVGPSKNITAGGGPGISFFWYNFDTHTIEAEAWPTSTYDPNFSCSFVDVILPPRKFATLIVSQDQVWVFRTYGSLDQAFAITPFTLSHNQVRPVQIVSLSTQTEPKVGSQPLDAFLGFDDVYFYSNTPPLGRVATVHKNKVFYGGFKGDKRMLLSGELPENQDNIPKNLLDGQAQVLLSKHLFCWSDPNDPLAVNETGFGTINYGDEVSAIHGFRNDVFVFSTEEMYGFTGGIDPSLTRLWKVEDVGCTAPHSLVTAASKFFWINHSGIWASDGQQVQRISDPIGNLFNPSTDETYLPDLMTQPFYNEITAVSDKGLANHWGYPWIIDKNKLHLATAVHHPADHQVWFSVTVFGPDKHPQRANNLTIVFDYELAAFTYYIDDEPGHRGFCVDGAHWGSPDGDRLFILSSEDTGGVATCSIQELNQPGGRDLGAGEDVGGGGTKLPTLGSGSYFWMTAKIARDNQQLLDFRRVRLNMLSWGQRPKKQYPVGGGTKDFELGPWWFIETENAAFDSHHSTSPATFRTAVERYSGKQLVICHPKAGDKLLDADGSVVDPNVPPPVKSFFWSEYAVTPTQLLGLWGSSAILDSHAEVDTLQWSGQGWFQQQMFTDAGEVNGRWCRVGMVQRQLYDDDHLKVGRDPADLSGPQQPLGIVRSISFEIEDMETTR